MMGHRAKTKAKPPRRGRALCPACRSKGDGTCPTCNGSGYIYRVPGSHSNTWTPAKAPPDTRGYYNY